VARRANVLLLGAALIAGCAQSRPPVPAVAPIASAPSPRLAAPIQADWNIFPDPITGRVEIYRDGAHVGSVTGEESEDPPVPRKRNSAGTD
jgi:hypothetical protein